MNTDLEILVDVALNSGAGDINTGSFLEILPENLLSILSFITTSAANLYTIEWISTQEIHNVEIECCIEIDYTTTRFGRVHHILTGLFYSKN